jgi:hypothetical protein
MKLVDLMAHALTLSLQDRRRLVESLIDSIRPNEVRDSEGLYSVRPESDSEIIGMKAVTLTLPDELANEAQAAGLFAEKRLEELLRRALSEKDASTAAVDLSRSMRKRRLVRENGRLVVEALPGEQPITDAEVRELLDKMEW